MDKKTRFEHFTKELRSAFPIWSKIRKDPNAIGSQFLSVIGKRVADIEWILTYVLEQLSIGTADLEQTDVIYTAYLPSNLKQEMNIRFAAGPHIYEQHYDMVEFLEPPQITNRYNALAYNTKCLVDYDTKRLYVHRTYNRGEKFRHGHVSITVSDSFGSVLFESDVELRVHHVWNFFDEFGLLLGLNRLEGEKNYEFRERILDVFRRPASSTRVGLLNGISRELGLVYEMTWDNGGKDFVLDRSRVVTESIYVDELPWSETFLYVDKSGRVTLKGHDDFEGTKRKVRFIAGVALHELHDERDTAFQNELRNVDGTATSLLQYYVEQIKDRVPIMWGQWKWNQGFWDVTNADMSGYGYIPNVYDATFSGWKDYKEE